MLTEIRNTASTQLEDPRLNSKRYIVKKDDKTNTLCSVTGRNIKIVPVDKKIWNVTQTCAAQLVQNVYMDIDNPISNLSMESGEIQSGRNSPFGVIVTKNLFNDLENARPGDAVSIPTKENPPESSDPPESQSSAANVSETIKYIIPKIKKVQEETISQSIVENVSPLETLIKTLEPKCEVTAPTHKVMEKRKPTKQKTETPKFVNDTSISEDKIEDNIKKEGIKLRISLKKLKQLPSAREIVAGDLELSDETCDDSEMLNDALKDNLKDKVQLDNLHKGVECGSHASQDKFKKVNVDSNTECNKRSPDANTELSPESSKKQKSKRRPQKHKGSSSKEISDSIATTKNQSDKKTRKKSNDSKPHTPHDIKERFSELFGDSSSLITPEDLGLAPVHNSLDKYLPNFENDQNANDVNVEETGKPRKFSMSVDTNRVQNEPVNTTADKTKSKPGKSFGERKKKNIRNRDEIKPDSTVEVPLSTEEIPLHKVKSNAVNDKNPEEVTLALFQTETTTKNIVLETPTLENLVPVTEAKAVDVVKTVIISTGVQSQATKNIEFPITNNIVNLTENQNITEKTEKHDVLKIQDPPINALATSTPYKGILLAQTKLESEYGSSNFEDNKPDRNGASFYDQTSTSNLDVQETDVPDVRIFVRRRRNVKK